LSLARGEWCALLDQDDELPEDALAEVACEIERTPDAAIIYSDEDFLDAEGVRSNPFFKPDWNPELFLAQNYLNHLGVYRTALLREIGGFREGFEGSQDYDLALRGIARLRPEQIHHIPRILYHWRMVEGSLADQPDAKPYARNAARRALNSYLAEGGIAARAEACPQNAESHRVVYRPPSPLPKVTIVSTADLKADWLEGENYPALEFVAAEPGAAGANFGAQKTQGDILLFLSGELCAAESGWLTEIVSQVVRPEVGAVGARLWSPEGKLEDGGLILGLGGIAAPAFHGLPRGHPGYFNRAWLQQNLSAVSGACLATRRDVFRALHGFDEKNLPHHFYDVDFCLRLRQLHAPPRFAERSVSNPDRSTEVDAALWATPGWASPASLRVIWTPYANMTFRGSGSREKAAGSREEAYMEERWGPLLHHDPFYNPNLSLDLPGFLMAIPPQT